jgi:hypothetical protein
LVQAPASARALDGLALALEQAGAYVDNQRLSFSVEATNRPSEAQPPPQGDGFLTPEPQPRIDQFLITGQVAISYFHRPCFDAVTKQGHGGFGQGNRPHGVLPSAC